MDRCRLDRHHTDHRRIAGLFNARIGRPMGTLLIGGATEPLYLPAARRRPALIRYTRDYARSALHEIAHWLLASVRGRRQVDYGMWYQAPPRSDADQARFYAAEVPVQALEMALSHSCGVEFRFSADNPGADDGCQRLAFEAAVRSRFADLCSERWPLDSTAAAVLSAYDPHWRERPWAASGVCGSGRA
jgi:elongation factor P hydroxylase